MQGTNENKNDVVFALNTLSLGVSSALLNNAGGVSAPVGPDRHIGQHQTASPVHQTAAPRTGAQESKQSSGSSQTAITTEPAECPICQDGTPARAIANCDAKHQFCNTCIAKQVAIESTCPLCRAQIPSYVAANGRTIAVSRRRQPTQPIHENAEPFQASDDEQMEEPVEPEPEEPSSLPTEPAQHVDAYNTIQSNLTLARESLAVALSIIQVNNIASFGEHQCRIPAVRDLDAYRAGLTTDTRSFIRKLTSLITQLTKALEKHTKIANKGYVVRVGSEALRRRQREQQEINSARADMNRRREQMRQEQQALDEREALLRRRPARR